MIKAKKDLYNWHFMGKLFCIGIGELPIFLLGVWFEGKNQTFIAEGKTLGEFYKFQFNIGLGWAVFHVGVRF